MRPATEPAVGTRHDVFCTDELDEPLDTIGHKFRMFDHRRGMRHHPGNKHFSFRQLYLFPDGDFMLVSRICAFNEVGTYIDLQTQISKCYQLQIEHRRAIPSAPEVLRSNPRC